VLDGLCTKEAAQLVGIPEGSVKTRAKADALVLSTAPALAAASVNGVVLVATFALLAADWAPGRGLAVFLTLAPMLPVAGVAAADGLETDPPTSSRWLRRTRRSGGCWLLPAAAFVLATLAAATNAPPRVRRGAHRGALGVRHGAGDHPAGTGGGPAGPRRRLLAHRCAGLLVGSAGADPAGVAAGPRPGLRGHRGGGGRGPDEACRSGSPG
jgi:hypothetical protein